MIKTAYNATGCVLTQEMQIDGEPNNSNSQDRFDCLAISHKDRYDD